jgi:hypothetical protein
MFTVNSENVRREYPNWNQRGRIKKTDGEGKILPGEFAFAGEVVRVSPRYQKNGTNFRVRPERPAYFFSQFLVENGLLPVPLTPEECEAEWALELLDPLWEQYKGYFPKLESPFAASDTTVVPSHRVGFSFNIQQLLVEPIGMVKTNGKPAFRTAVNGSAPNPSIFDAMRKRIEEQRAKAAATKQDPPAPTKKKS